MVAELFHALNQGSAMDRISASAVIIALSSVVQVVLLGAMLLVMVCKSNKVKT